MKMNIMLERAQRLDQSDPLSDFRSLFHIPFKDGKSIIYFTGNSLGLAPKTAQTAIQQELNDWAKLGVEGHFHAKNPWYSYHEWFSPALAPLVGALPSEVVAMNQLSVNLHLLLASFYKPTKERYKIICEAKAFPSDLYALQTHVAWHGLNPKDTIIEINSLPNKQILYTDQITDAIKEAGDSLALVMMGGVNYYSGQVLNMSAITKAAHEVGALAGFDLAHAIGNIPLQLHAWQVDFAAWCSYKYLNSGPGSVAGIFIHEKHAKNKELNRLGGWWGHNKDTRFQMEPDFDPIATAEGWQLSNAPVLSMAAHRSSLEVFHAAGIENVFKKGKELARFTKEILTMIKNDFQTNYFDLITPCNDDECGCQVSLLFHQKGKEVFQALTDAGVVVDWREPNVIRLAPVPLYNKFIEVYRFGNIIHQILSA
ncbi:kynureninase [Gynurincola endophyticus]|jgi:kynureninase|uniref:kynureninase n=1 Tax=Gynurincola endophyticus TaxID=2479004 RepID=UPI000F8CCA78|nr:kynureninase [Gynurincola endophyticus]